MPARLKHFPEHQVMIYENHARQILEFFNFRTSGLTISAKDREFAQALMVEAIDASNKMGWVQAAAETALKLRPEVGDIAKALVFKALGNWYSKNIDKNKVPDIYKSVRDHLSLHFKSYWDVRRNGGDSLPNW